MTRREIAALCCRVLALVVLAWSVVTLVAILPALGSSMIEWISGRDGPVSTLIAPQVTAFGIVGCAGLLIAMALAWKTEYISRWMASDDPAPVTGPELSVEALMPVACAGVGLFTIARALPTFLRLLTGMLFTETPLTEYWADDDWKVSLASDGLLMAFGVWLTFGSRGLVRLIMWSRSAATTATTAVADSSSPISPGS